MTEWKILMADDDPDDIEIIQDAISEIHSPEIIRFAANGEEVLNILHALPGRSNPCLIILDLNMPKLNGTQTLKVLKSHQQFKNIPVIIYSTSINPVEKEKCLRLGAHSYVTKPVSYNESIETVKSFLGFCGIQIST
jgi:CheY-like chemotaxis protein